MNDAAVMTAVGQRVADWLRQAYPRDGAKLAAQDLKVSPHTTRRWFEGRLPENLHMALLARKFGKRFIAFVYEPVVGPWGDYGISEELAEIRDRLDTVQRSLLRGPFNIGPVPVADRGAAAGAGHAAVVARPQAQRDAAAHPSEAEMKEAAE